MTVQMSTALPSRDLAPVVKMFWEIRRTSQTIASEPQIIVPDGCMEFIFEFSTPSERPEEVAAGAQSFRSVVAGQLEQGIRCAWLLDSLGSGSRLL